MMSRPMCGVFISSSQIEKVAAPSLSSKRRIIARAGTEKYRWLVLRLHDFRDTGRYARMLLREVVIFPEVRRKVE